MPAIRSITSTEYAAELRQRLAESGTSVPLQWESAIRLLKLAPNTPINEVIVDSTVSNIGAYYSTEDKRVTVIEDSTVDQESASWLLSHEFVHSLQDRSVDLKAFEEQWTNSTDEVMALTSLIEGEAIVHPNILQARRHHLPPERADWNGYESELLDSVLTTVQQAPSPFITALQLLPYPIGFRFLIGRWLHTGQSAINDLFRTPELWFLEWVMALEPPLRTTLDPLTCFPTKAPPGYVPFDHDRLGAAGLMAFHIVLQQSGQTALIRGTDLRDDSIVVFMSAPDAPSPGVAVAWRLRFVDDWTAGRFLRTLEASQTSFASLSVESFEREVLIRAASDVTVLSAWTNAAECGAADELPVRSDTADSMSAAVRRSVHR